MLPKARETRIVVQELADEVLVYDTDRHRAHCLNRVAATVWRECDGKSDLESIAARCAAKLALPIDQEVVLLAIERLEKARLLEAPVVRRTSRPISRRKAMIAVAVIPAVLSILAPSAAQAASCAPKGSSCASAPCCGGAACCRFQACTC